VDLENPTLEPNRKWIGRRIAEIWPFVIMCYIWLSILLNVRIWEYEYDYQTNWQTSINQSINMDLRVINQVLYHRGSHLSLILTAGHSASPVCTFWAGSWWQHLNACASLPLNSPPGYISPSNHYTQHRICYRDLQAHQHSNLLSCGNESSCCWDSRSYCVRNFGQLKII